MFCFLFQMKLPASIGQKKTKAIEQVLEELSIGWDFIFMTAIQILLTSVKKEVIIFDRLMIEFFYKYLVNI